MAPNGFRRAVVNGAVAATAVAGKQPTHFQLNPPGRGRWTRLTVFKQPTDPQRKPRAEGGLPCSESRFDGI
jgi:hypothetical protein